jgi:hypothetical protein
VLPIFCPVMVQMLGIPIVGMPHKLPNISSRRQV